MKLRRYGQHLLPMSGDITIDNKTGKQHTTNHRQRTTNQKQQATLNQTTNSSPGLSLISYDCLYPKMYKMQDGMPDINRILGGTQPDFLYSTILKIQKEMLLLLRSFFYAVRPFKSAHTHAYPSAQEPHRIRATRSANLTVQERNKQRSRDAKKSAGLASTSPSFLCCEAEACKKRVALRPIFGVYLQDEPVLCLRKRSLKHVIKRGALPPIF